MGENADGILDGLFDSVTGEYLGEGCGFPRSIYDKNRYKSPSNGVSNYLATNKIGDRKEKRKVVRMFCEEFLKYDYELNGHEKSCFEIQKVFNEFKKFVTDYKKGAFE